MRKTPKEVVELLNNEYYIPAIQRRFVWKKEQVSMLFDSILRNFPIGQMLIKESSKDEVSDNPTYNFVNRFVVDDLQDFSSGNHNNPRVDKIDSNPVKLVFDGQQRLTALNIGLNGCIYERDNKYKSKKEDNYVKKFLCMNLLSEPDEPVEDAESFDQSKGGEAPHYEFEFRKNTEFGYQNNSSYWYRVSEITDIQNVTDVTDFVNSSDIPNSKSGVAIDNLMELHQKIHSLECVDINTVKNKDSDEMLEIFLRMNRSGTQISDTDTALSIITYKWRGEDNIVAREAIEDYVADLNSRFIERRNPVSENTLVKMLKICSLPNSDIASFHPSIKIEQLTDREGELPKSMKETWKDDDFRKSVDKYIKLCKDFSIPTKRIGSVVVYGPIISYMYSRDSIPLDKESKLGLLNRQRILYWITSSVSLGLASAASARRARNTIKAVYESDALLFPLKDVVESVESEVPLKFERNTMELTEINEGFYDSQISDFFLKLMHIHRISRQEYETSTDYDKDHIFPRNKIDDEMENRLGNIQYIKSNTNRRKQNQKFSDWARGMTDEYKTNHYIPEVDLENQVEPKEFISKREDKIVDTLREVYKELSQNREPITKHPNQ